MSLLNNFVMVSISIHQLYYDHCIMYIIKPLLFPAVDYNMISFIAWS